MHQEQRVGGLGAPLVHRDADARTDEVMLPRRRLAVLTDTEPVADLTSPFDPPVVPAERVDDPNALHFIEDDPK